MNRETRRSKRIKRATPDQLKAIKALDDHAIAWLQKRMQEPDAASKTVQELVEEYWKSLKEKKDNDHE